MRVDFPWIHALARRAFSVASWLVSIVLHLTSLFLPLWGGEGTPPLYGREYAVLVVASLVLSSLGYWAKGLAWFRFFHGLRFLLVSLALAAIAPGHTLSTLLLCSSFLYETTLAERLLPALFINLVTLTSFTLMSVLVSGAHSGASPWLFSLAQACFLAFITALSCLVIEYREKAVRHEKEIASLAETVHNLDNANRSFQAYANKIEMESRENERRRITRELHDSVGYALTNVIVMMNAGKVVLKEDPEGLPELFDTVRQESEKALRQTRLILHKLRDIHGVQRMGLSAIRQLSENFRGATNIEVKLSLGNLISTYGSEIDSLLVRFVQEGLTNSFRHGKATKVEIVLQQSESELIAVVRDNGQGLPEGVELVEGIGFQGMRERLAEFGGNIVARNIWGGFELTAYIPYKARMSEEAWKK